jgi:EpsI family protein
LDRWTGARVNWRILTVAAMFVATVFLRAQLLGARQVTPPPVNVADFPLVLDGWHGTPDMPFDSRIEGILKADQYVNRNYTLDDGFTANVYIGYYRAQRHGATMHSPLNCLPGSGWQPVRSSRVALFDDAGASVVNRVIVQQGDSRQIVYYWYQSKNRIVASEYWSKWYLISDSVRSGRTDAALVRIVAPENAPGIAGAELDGRMMTLARSAATNLAARVFPF